VVSFTYEKFLVQTVALWYQWLSLVVLHMWKFAKNANLLSLCETLNLQNFLWKTSNETTVFCKDMILIKAAYDTDH
jgi:hypothetical protein